MQKTIDDATLTEIEALSNSTSVLTEQSAGQLRGRIVAALQPLMNGILGFCLGHS